MPLSTRLIRYALLLAVAGAWTPYPWHTAAASGALILFAYYYACLAE